VTRPERHQRIILLDRTLSDFDYQPPTWTGALVQRQGASGEGPTTRATCEACDGEGKIRRRGQWWGCAFCGGTDAPLPLVGKEGRGWVVVDSYTERKIGTAETELVDRRRRVRCDACGGAGAHGNGRRCDYCNGSGTVPGPEQTMRPFRGANAALSANASDLGRGDPVLACMERRELAGSYHELGLSLACLRLQHRGLFRLHVRVFIEAICEEDDLDGSELFLLDQSLRYLEALMPAEIRVPSWAPRYEQRRRERVEEEAKVA
jgi:hypothetical protein